MFFEGTQRVLCCFLFGSAVVQCAAPSSYSGACQVTPDDIVFVAGTSAAGPRYNYSVVTPWYSNTGLLPFFV